MSQYAKSANEMVKHGHVKVGLETVRDPAFHVTPEMEDFITWANDSAYKYKKDEYNNAVSFYLDQYRATI